MADATPPILYIGHHDRNRDCAANLEHMRRARSAGFDMITVPVTNHVFRDHVSDLIAQYRVQSVHGKATMPVVPSLNPEYTALDPVDPSSSFTGLCSDWADVGSADPVVACVSRQVIILEVAYAAFCGITTLVLPPIVRQPHGPNPEAIARYADAVGRALGIGPYMQLLVPFPMDNQRLPQDMLPTDIYDGPHGDAPARTRHDSFTDDTLVAWDAWNHLRSTCDYASKLALALVVPRLLPSEHLQSRWYSEPIRLLMLPESTFVTNPKGHPVLSKAHQAMLFRFMRLQQSPWLILTGPDELPSEYDIRVQSREPTPAEAAKGLPHQFMAPRLSYLRYLQRAQPPLPPLARFAQGYQDYLQSPLQPLTDNLESITYEVFEKDPIKYAWYEQAIGLALTDLHKSLNRPIIVAVVGAGRGPLVTRSLLASATTGVPILAYAVEKNMNALVLLQRRITQDPLWAGQVQVIKTDMRTWKGPVDADGKPVKVDILVSELLGSFACNEMSPECLDGVQHQLHPNHGISIPQSYTAWVTPLASPRIYTDLLHRPPDPQKWNLPYVTMLHQYSYLSYTDRPLPPTEAGLFAFEPSIQQCWEFAHPVPQTVLDQSNLRRQGGQLAPGFSGGDGWNEHNARSCHLTFPASKANRGVCHGLAGYFETVLYRSRDSTQVVELSTNPNTMEDKSRDMISWFPIFFPIKTPLYVPDGSQIRVEMHRKTDDRKVWYAWQIGVWVEVAGLWQRVGLSDVHSSVQHGCLM